LRGQGEKGRRYRKGGRNKENDGEGGVFKFLKESTRGEHADTSLRKKKKWKKGGLGEPRKEKGQTEQSKNRRVWEERAGFFFLLPGGEVRKNFGRNAIKRGGMRGGEGGVCIELGKNHQERCDSFLTRKLYIGSKGENRATKESLCKREEKISGRDNPFN